MRGGGLCTGHSREPETASPVRSLVGQCGRGNATDVTSGWRTTKGRPGARGGSNRALNGHWRVSPDSGETAFMCHQGGTLRRGFPTEGPACGRGSARGPVRGHPVQVTPFTVKPASLLPQPAFFSLTPSPHCPSLSRAAVSSSQNGIPHLESQSHTLKQPGGPWEAPQAQAALATACLPPRRPADPAPPSRHPPEQPVGTAGTCTPFRPTTNFWPPTLAQHGPRLWAVCPELSFAQSPAPSTPAQLTAPCGTGPASAAPTASEPPSAD